MAQNIEDIIATDKKAREIVQKAQDRREFILNGAQTERDRVISDGKNKLEHLKSSLHTENDDFEKACKAQTQKTLEEKKSVLLSQYEKGETKWTAEIFARLTDNA